MNELSREKKKKKKTTSNCFIKERTKKERNKILGRGGGATGCTPHRTGTNCVLRLVNLIAKALSRRMTSNSYCTVKLISQTNRCYHGFCKGS